MTEALGPVEWVLRADVPAPLPADVRAAHKRRLRALIAEARADWRIGHPLTGADPAAQIRAAPGTTPYPRPPADSPRTPSAQC